MSPRLEMLTHKEPTEMLLQRTNPTQMTTAPPGFMGR